MSEKEIEDKLIEIEKKILAKLPEHETKFVSIGDEEQIWTISFNKNSQNIPLVLVHGYGDGIGVWTMNFEFFSKNRPVHAIDLLGFARSSRTNLGNSVKEVEEKWVDSIEKWRAKMNLNKFILLGHSLGSYVSLLYTIKYPEKIHQLIFADPWGIGDDHENSRIYYRFAVALSKLSPPPMAVFRFFGASFTIWLLKNCANGIYDKFGEELKETMMQYTFYCNASKKATGEKGASLLITGFGWPKSPLIKRFDKLPKNIPLTFLYAADSIMDKRVTDKIKEFRREENNVDIHIIEKSGHMLQFEQADEFNNLVQKALEKY